MIGQPDSGQHNPFVKVGHLIYLKKKTHHSVKILKF